MNTLFKLAYPMDPILFGTLFFIGMNVIALLVIELVAKIRGRRLDAKIHH